MSGIYLSVSKKNNNEQLNIHCADLIKHRGNSERIIFKGPNWISIFYDLKTSNEKNFFSNDNYLILVDGKIYNLAELKKKYKMDSFYSNELELFSKLFLKFHTKIFQEINGMFSILIIDKKENKIYGIKDKLGLKPLFYFFNNDELIISSEAKSILKKNDSCKIDYQNSLASIFLCGRPPYGKTHFKNVFDIEQSNYLEFSINDFKPKIYNYFNLSLWINKKQYGDNKKLKDNEILNLYENAFSNVIKHQSANLENYSTLFSAGLDSSMVSTFLSKIYNKDINLYYFESEVDDFSKYYKNYLEDNKNFKLNKLKTQDKNFIIDLPKMIYHYECTAKEEASPIAFLSNLAKKNNHKVLLTGDGDTILGGSYTHTSFFTRSFLYQWKGSRFFLKLMNRLSNSLLQSGAEPSTIDYLYFPSFFNLSEVFTNVMLHEGERLDQWKNRINLYSFVEDKAERETQAFVLDDTFYRFQRYMIRQDRACSRHSIEFRYPFLDDEILKLSVNMPLRIKQRFNFFQSGERLGRITEAKSIVRSLAKKIGVPKKIYNRNEVGSPFNNIYYKKIFKHWGLKHLSNFLNVPEQNLVKCALESYDPNLARVQYSFIANELLLRIYDDNQDPQDISDKFSDILSNN